jgi:hypothetical protein
MPTVLQQNLAKEIIQNTKRKKPKNKGELVEMGGYSKTVAEAKPQVIIDQKGVQEALDDFGFSENNAKKVVSSIMLNEKTDPNPRLKATDQVFKVHGSYAPDKNININMNVKSIDPTNPEVLEALKTINKQRANEQ